MSDPNRSDAAPTGLEPMLGIADVARALGCSRRLVERMRAAGKFPRADVQLGRLPRWKRSTFVQWVAQGGRP